MKRARHSTLSQRHVPAYAPAQRHLAEVEGDVGEIKSAVARLYSLAVSSDDPDYAAQLARILGEAARAHESQHWCRLAAARYDELVTSYPEAFADHAAEFWLAAGANPEKALRFARMNVEVHKTPRPYGLLAQAVAANEGLFDRERDRAGNRFRRHREGVAGLFELRFDRLTRHALREVRPNHARRNDGDAQVIACLLLQTLGDGANRELRPGIDRHGWRGLVTCNRGDVDELSESLRAKQGSAAAMP